ncbi:NAD(P)/FAD-dependent oxidoreductase [Candidatus Dojkabacteria bacterium]|uniref:NAD(P)/FAD-dependent oxidoreductase n=1 Tax=Candidatus Dojkabacteria bacterium TaxID=2099670 RepID=A0A3M0Z1H1_9BACT|nr:MAG: NAD(P)/FAD-dependent oxidoreductase [Candidatus Dojkabacteria bacterium]
MNKFDLIIVGGGAAGMMASISFKRKYKNRSVALIDRTFALGRKILVCGAGRCNITNINLSEDTTKYYYGAPKFFIQSIFDQFGFEDIKNFFIDLGIPLYVERKTDIGKMFPITDQAKSVTALLEDEIQRLGVEIFLNTEVIRIKKESNLFILDTKNIGQNNKNCEIKFGSEFLILSAGGKTYPALGSNGSGYNLAMSLGHRLIKPVPSAVPLESKNTLSQQLQGLKFEMTVTSIIEDKKVKTRTDDVMFTQYGFSGPAILNISREISIHINRKGGKDVKVMLNFLPNYTFNEALKLLETRWNKRPEQTLEKSLYGLFPNKFSEVFLKCIDFKPYISVNKLSENDKITLAKYLTEFIVSITGTRGWNEAEFTAGGIDTSELKPFTLESKIVDKLYFCGEILDVDGDVGGFNLSWAWASGFVAGLLN